MKRTQSEKHFKRVIRVRRNKIWAGNEMYRMVSAVNSSPFLCQPSETMRLSHWAYDGETFVLQWTHREQTWRLIADDSTSFQVYNNCEMKYWLRGFIRRVR